MLSGGESHGQRMPLAQAGVLLLVLGALHYLFVRPATALALWPSGIAAFPTLATMPSVLAGSLPTFLHTSAFACLTAAAAGGRTALPAAALAWATVNAGFELGQHPAAAAALESGLGDSALLPVAFFRHGTFDVLDLAAAAAAALLCAGFGAAGSGRGPRAP